MINQLNKWKLTMNKKGFIGLAILMASLTLSGSLLASTPIKGGNFVAAFKNGGSSDSLDPALSKGGTTYQLMRAFGDWLVEVDKKGAIVPRLATDIRSDNAGKTWHFTIRQGVKFHNGKLLNAQDVLKTMQRHGSSDSKSGALGVMRGIDSMEVNDNIFTIHLKTANADLPYLMSDYHLMIQKNGGVGSPADGIGTGPYKLVSAQPGVHYKLEKFADYWDDNRGHYASYEVFVINDDTARMAALQSRKAHAIDYINPKTAKLLTRNKNIRVERNEGKGHAIFVMQTDTPPFDNNDLRLALKYSIDREAMVEKILRGYGTVGNDTPINVAYPLFDPTLEQRRFDLDKAREHYKKSGHDGSPITLHVADVAFANALDAAQLFQQSAKKAGITIEISRKPDGGYWSDVWNKMPFVASYWGGRSVQDEMWSTAYLSTADWNDSHFKNAKFDQMLLQARAELNPQKRQQLYAQMARLVHDEGGVINFMFYQNLDGVSEKIAGWETNPEGAMMNGLVASKTWFNKKD